MAHRTNVSAQSLVTGDPVSWEEASERLNRAETYWLATVRTDSRPHARPLLGLWMEDRFFFTTNERARKGINLVRNPKCAVTVTSLDPPPLDIVVEGSATRVMDEARLRVLARAYDKKYGWPVTVRDRAFFGDGAPTAGPPPYAVFEVAPTAVYGFPGVSETDDAGEAEGGNLTPTRWRF